MQLVRQLTQLVLLAATQSHVQCITFQVREQLQGSCGIIPSI